MGARQVSKEGQLHLVRSQAMHESPDCNVHLAIYLVKLLESPYLHTYTNTNRNTNAENMQKKHLHESPESPEHMSHLAIYLVNLLESPHKYKYKKCMSYLLVMSPGSLQ